ncbi:MAG: AAA family ATPase, partial [Planctomycetota bacterium]
AVILLDEMEKAHPDVFNILLQVLDDGRLTDGQGRTVDFTNTVIVMTSNAGSQLIQKVTADGGSEDEIRQAVDETLRSRFLPEFLNRIDETVIFRPLDRNQIRSIVALQLESLNHRLIENGLAIKVSDAALDRIAEIGYDPTYGARPLKRVIQREVQNPLATALLKNAFAAGSTIQVDLQGDEFIFRVIDQPKDAPALSS